MSSTLQARQPPFAWKSLAAVLLFWFATSILFNYLTPQLIGLVANQDVTMLELSVTVCFGLVTNKLRGIGVVPPLRRVPKWLLVGSLHLLGCRSFVYGLKFIPVSLAQTIRASSPMVAVPISYLAFGERCPWQVLPPLAAILAGFALSVGADGAGADPAGCGAAVASLCCLVLVNGASKAEEHHPFAIQLWVCVFAWLALFPLWVLGGGPARLAAFSGDRWKLAGLVLMDGCMYYAEQVSQNQVLKSLPFLPFAVIDTLRRLAIVCVSGFFIQGNTCTLLNAVGILLVLSGAISYNIARAGATRPVVVAEAKKAD